MEFIFFIYFAVIIFYIASLWIVLTKAGQPGWAILIPFYNTYVLLKVGGKPGWWLLLMFIPFVNIVVSILMTVGISKNFGKGLGFAIGLIFLSMIFYPILAFGEAKYMAQQQ